MSDSDDDKPLGQRTAVPAPALARKDPPDVASAAPISKQAQPPAKPVLQPKPVRPPVADDSDDDLPLAKRHSAAGEPRIALWQWKRAVALVIPEAKYCSFPCREACLASCSQGSKQGESSPQAQVTAVNIGISSASHGLLSMRSSVAHAQSHVWQNNRRGISQCSAANRCS